MDFRDTAIEIAGSIKEQLIDWYPNGTNGMDGLDRLRNQIESTLLAAATVPPGHVRVGTEDMRLLGTLPKTQDGAVIGDWAKPHVLHVNGEVHQGVARTTNYSWTTTLPGRKENKAYAADLCYSTEAAALAAKGAPDAK